MPALLPIILTASHIVLVADAVPKFNVEQTCRRAGEVSVSLGRSAVTVSVMKKMRTASCNRTGHNRVRRSAPAACDSLRSAVRPVTSNC